jgi:ABC-type glutathione transport system ATPase component
VPLFTISDLSIRTTGGLSRRSRVIVAGVSAELREGELLAVLGRSGAGKTVLWRAMLGLSSPGLKVTYRGRVPALSDAAFERWRRSSVGFVHQGAQRSLMPDRSPEEYLGRLFRMSDVPVARRRFTEASTKLGLPLARGDLDRPIATFSGGETQRIALALRLAAQPTIMVLDEPSAALDFEAAHRMKALVTTIVESFRVSVICVTHDYHFIAGLARRALYIEDGRAREMNLEAGTGASPQAEDWIAMSRREADEYGRFFGPAARDHRPELTSVPIRMLRAGSDDAR